MHWLTAKEVMEEVKKSKDLSAYVKDEIRKLVENAERLPKPREKQQISIKYSRFLDRLHDLQEVADDLAAELSSNAERASDLRMEIEYILNKIETTDDDSCGVEEKDPALFQNHGS